MLHLINDLISFLLVADRDYRFETIWFDVGVIVFTVLSFFIPDQKRRFIILSIFQLLIFLLATPWVGNHVLPHAFLSAAGIFFLIKNRKKQSAADIEKDFFPQFFVIFSFFYFITTFYKLNFGFFDPEESCSVYVLERISKKLGLEFIQWLGPAILLVPLIFVFEGLFPALTRNRRWRPWALMAIISFHVVLSVHYFEFLPLVLIFMTQILNPKEQELLKTQWTRFYGALWKQALVLVLFVVFKMQVSPSFVGALGEPIFGILGIVLGCAVSLPFILVLKQSSQSEELPQFKINGYGIVFAILMLVSGLSPFFGFRTIGTLGMYSNLRTEAANNHFIMPNLNLTSAKDDLVRLDASAGPLLKKIMPYWVIPEGDIFEIPRYELSRVLARMDEAQRNILRPRIYDRKQTVEELVESYEQSPFYKKLFFGFHPVSFYDLNACTW